VVIDTQWTWQLLGEELAKLFVRDGTVDEAASRNTGITVVNLPVTVGVRQD
jgi:hypothetical protein